MDGQTGCMGKSHRGSDEKFGSSFQTKHGWSPKAEETHQRSPQSRRFLINTNHNGLHVLVGKAATPPLATLVPCRAGRDENRDHRANS